jgi:hypothetical protein
MSVNVCTLGPEVEDAIRRYLDLIDLQSRWTATR